MNAGYNDGKGFNGDEAIPKDPTVTRPMQPGSSLTAWAACRVPCQRERPHGAQTAIQDVIEPDQLRHQAAW